MEHENAPEESSETRPPTIDDIKSICSRLNSSNVKYMLIGGFAVNYYGFPRATQGIDFLVDPSDDNILKIKKALLSLPDKAVEDIKSDDVRLYSIVRIADEIVIDLTGKIGDLKFTDAKMEIVDFDGVKVPIADIDTLIKTKQGFREKDKIDLQFPTMLKNK